MIRRYLPWTDTFRDHFLAFYVVVAVVIVVTMIVAHWMEGGSA